MLGGLTVTVSGPCFDGHSDTSNVVCKFDDIVTPATVIDATRAQCVLPALLKTGQVPVAVSTDGGHNYGHAGLFTLGKYPWRPLLVMDITTTLPGTSHSVSTGGGLYWWWT